jgi:hypothetical protein
MALLTQACAWKHAISGVVVDRNGEPVSRANVTLMPGNVEIATNDVGQFLIDYTRDAGEVPTRKRLDSQQAYTIEVFKAGFHIRTLDIYFSRGQLVMDPIELVEETIVVRDDELDLDVGLFNNPTHSSGATYEGQ